MKCWQKKVEPPTKTKKHTWLIVKSTVREIQKLDNWNPSGAKKIKKENVTEYLWYNGSTTFKNGEKEKSKEFKREREDGVKTRKKKQKNSHNEDPKLSELSMIRLKCQ